MSSSAERRLLPRIVTAVRVDALDGGPRMFAQDISLGGMMVTTTEPRWPGAHVPVRFKLPGQERHIRVTCRVVELVEVPAGVGMSLQFLRVASEAQQAIARYVDERPLPDYEDLQVSDRIQSWMERILEDCQQLKALASTSR